MGSDRRPGQMDRKTPRTYGSLSNTRSVEVAITDTEHTSWRWRNQYDGMAALCAFQSLEQAEIAPSQRMSPMTGCIAASRSRDERQVWAASDQTRLGEGAAPAPQAIVSPQFQMLHFALIAADSRKPIMTILGPAKSWP